MIHDWKHHKQVCGLISTIRSRYDLTSSYCTFDAFLKTNYAANEAKVLEVVNETGINMSEIMLEVDEVLHKESGISISIFNQIILMCISKFA